MIPLLKKGPFLMVPAILLTISIGCSGTNEAAVQQDISTIDQVLHHQFNGPDDDLIRLLDDPDHATVIGETDDAEENTNGNDELDAYYQEQYGAYFTEQAYEEFVRVHAGYHQMIAEKNQMEMSVDELAIT